MILLGENQYGQLVKLVKRITRVCLISAIEKEKNNVIETRVYRYYQSYN